MRALLIMPMTEISHYKALDLMVSGQKHGFDSLSVPSYADYLTSVGLAKNLDQAIFMALSTVSDFINNTTGDCLVIGTCSRNIQFDVILNVNPYHEEGEAVEDLELQQLRERYGNDPDLGPIINNLYSTADGEYAAAADSEAIIQLVTELCKAKLNQTIIIQNNRKLF